MTTLKFKYAASIDPNDLHLRVESKTPLPINLEGKFKLSTKISKNYADNRVGFALLGMHWFDPADRMFHTDGVRANATQILCPMLRVFTVGKRNRSSTNTCLDGDIRNRRMWESSSRYPKLETIESRRTEVAAVDYYWLPRIYLEENNGYNGYGDKWIRRIAPRFFSTNGKVLFLPNDRWKMFRGMWSRDSHKKAVNNVGLFVLSLKDAFKYHPLLAATQLAIQSPAWSKTLQPESVHRTNKLAIEEYLNPEFPFLVLYNKLEFDDINSVMCYLNNIRTPEYMTTPFTRKPV